MKYRIISSNNNESLKHSPILFTHFTYPVLNNIRLNEWRNGYFDIQVSSYGENCGIESAIFDDNYHDIRVVFK